MDDGLDGERRAGILAARVDSVFGRVVGATVVSIVNAGLMTLVLSRRGVMPAAAWWLAMVSVLGGARVVSGLIYAADARKADHIQRWETLAVIGALLSGLVWGFGAASLFTADPINQWLWTLLIGGMCAGAASLHATHAPTAVAFIFPCCAPLAMRLAQQGTPQGLAAGAMILTFLIIVSMNAHRFSRRFGETASLQIALERRTAELDEANLRLNREIEDHRVTGENLHRAQKMEAMGQLTGGIAHDFNNLLTVIVGNLGLIVDRTEEDETVKRLANSAMIAADRGARLTTSLLAFARRQALRPEPVDINALILDFAPLLRRAAGDKVRFELVLSKSGCPSNVDVAHFQSALLNLVINARDAMPGEGLMIVSTETVQLVEADLAGAQAQAGPFVKVCVHDSGAGMSEETASKAFDPFFTTKSGGKGSGLGLSQVYGFAQQSGGTTGIFSRPGLGAQVSIYLPVWEEALPEPTLRPSAPAMAPGHPMRVLLVDDDADVLVTLREGLSRNGWDALLAADAEAALGMLDRYEDIGVLVTDVDMPAGMNGVELAKAVRRRRPELPTLLISGLPLSSFGAGQDFDILQKPFTPEQLAERIVRGVSQHRSESAAPL